MKKLIINGRKVSVYDSIDEMPIVNFQKYNKYLLIDSGIGSDADDIDAHISRVAQLVRSGDPKKALRELQNMRQNMHMVNCEISPRYMAFAALVRDIDGEKVEDLSDDGLKAVLARIKGVSHGALVSVLEWLKKKVSEELDVYFPANATDAREKEAYDRLRLRTLLVLDSVCSGTDNSAKIGEIDGGFMARYEPKTFIGPESVEVKYDKQFEATCLLVTQRTGVDARGMTVLRFYGALETLREQAEADAKSLKLNDRRRHGGRR